MTEAQKLKPLMGFLLVKPIEKTEVAAEGLIMPETYKESLMKAEVIASHKLIRFNDVVAPMQVQQDDLVYFFPNPKHKILLDSTIYYLIPQEEVFALSD